MRDVHRHLPVGALTSGTYRYKTPAVGNAVCVHDLHALFEWLQDYVERAKS